jgi:hypothetical protein
MAKHRAKSAGPIRFPFDCSDGETRTCKGQRTIKGLRVLLATDGTKWALHPTIGQLCQPYDGDAEDDDGEDT